MKDFFFFVLPFSNIYIMEKLSALLSLLYPFSSEY